MSESTSQSSVPKAVIHKRILTTAAEEPDASIERLASTTPGATTDLVERVLETYGDPAESMEADPAMSTHTRIDPDDLTDAQLETLQSIYEDPDATQATLADRLGVADATINQRLSTIAGFDWDRRESRVSELFERGDFDTGNRADTTDRFATGFDTLESRIETIEELLDERTAELTTRLSDVEHSIKERENGDENARTNGREPLDDELLAKVVRACVTHETITEEEEQRIIEYLR